MKEHRHFEDAGYQCSRECPAFGLTMTPTALVHLDSAEDMRAALEAYPQHLRHALDGNPHHMRMVLETHFAFAFLAITPWRLFT